VQVFYSDGFPLPLPPGHRFPAGKYARLRQALLEEGVLTSAELVEAQPASRADLERAHTSDYVRDVFEGTLPRETVRAIGLPWSPELVARSRASVGGSLAAARSALRDGIAGNLAGGTHHALAGSGQGFCVFNDLAVVARVLLAEGVVRRISIVDLDVHQGNGTAAILAADSRVFLLSLHGEKNFPFRKVASTLDVPLPDGTDDEAYLEALRPALAQALAFDPQLVLYQAGVDPLAEDKLGRLALTFDGLYRRDRLVLSACRERGLPVALTLGGGYADPIDLTVRAHVGTYRAAKALYG
jgi:acetoin utilization deacetylase AcuC-like enzyme